MLHERIKKSSQSIRKPLLKGLHKNKPIIQEEPQMVKKQKNNTKNPISKEDYKKSEEARKISTFTH
jgi:hypothetical protein